MRSRAGDGEAHVTQQQSLKADVVAPVPDQSACVEWLCSGEPRLISALPSSSQLRPSRWRGKPETAPPWIRVYRTVMALRRATQPSPGVLSEIFRRDGLDLAR